MTHDDLAMDNVRLKAENERLRGVASQLIRFIEDAGDWQDGQDHGHVNWCLTIAEHDELERLYGAVEAAMRRTR